MNFDRFNPLSNYLYSSGNKNSSSPATKTAKQGSALTVPTESTHHNVVDDHDDLGGEMSDWGIEESTQTTNIKSINNLNSNNNNNNNNNITHGLLSSPSITSNSTTTSNHGNYNKINGIHINQNQHQNQNQNQNQLIDDFFPLPPPQPSYIHNQPQQHHHHHHHHHQSQVSSLQQNHYYNHPLRKLSTTLLLQPISTPIGPESESEPDFKYYYDTLIDNQISFNTENFSKFIKRYLSLENKLNEFWEKFKYNLILSNLLEDSMVLSKNETNLNNLEQNNNNTSPDKGLQRFNVNSFIYSINDDGTILKILNRQYELNYNYNYNNMKIIISVILMIIYLLKQQQLMSYQHQHQHHHNYGLSIKIQFKLFKIIIYISMKLIKVKKFKLIIESNQILLNLQKFLILNYKINKKLIIQLINLKGDQLNLISNSSGGGDGFEQQLKQYLFNILLLLNLNLQNSIIKLLPFMNGELLEQYCLMNNIKIDILNQDNEIISTVGRGYTLGPSSNSNSSCLDNVKFHFKKFDNLRKLFICQLLIINQPSKPNFFLFKLMDQFNIDDSNSSSSFSENFFNNSVPIFDSLRLKIIHDLLIDHNLTLSNINGLFEKFEFVNQKTSTIDTTSNNTTTKDLVNDLNNSFLSKLHLDELINKLSNLTINLKYFQKYNNSIKNFHNIDEHQDKLLIFNQFKQDLNNIKSLYKSSLIDLNHEIDNNPQNFILPGPGSPTNTTTTTTTTTISSPTNSNGNRFSLKEFSIKKRSSITTPTPPLTTTHSSNGNGNGNVNVNSKRFSGAFTVIQPNRFSLITNISEIEDFNI